ncbi:MAG: acylphosphatase [Bacteroidales bacterium]|nr:acylphosphatase [Bacteroidales bacterium]
MKKCLRISIKGSLRGVGIRFRAMEAAYRMDIRGTVRYLKDYSVLIEAEGEERNLEDFVGWCRKGPTGARVQDLVVEEIPTHGYERFDIIRGYHQERSSG